jgi:O-antigen/teichoic acid export membrane protein
VAVVSGLLGVFRDGGLATATVQKDEVTRAQVSNLFWCGLVIGAVCALMMLVLAPVLAWAFREPRLVGITFALAAPFLLSSLTVQHHALLARQMRFSALAAVEMISLLVGIGVGVAMAMKGFGYWALVGIAIASALASAVAYLWAMPWVPSRPKRGAGIRPMLRFGGFLTGSTFLNYTFRNADNALIGWYWGAGPLGLYTKAYGLLMLPIIQVNSPMSGVAVPALSRLRAEPDRFRRTFLGAYTILASAILPIVGMSAAFAQEIVLLVLGPGWQPSVLLFQLLAPAALLGALLNPFGWIFISTGRPDRQMRFGILWSLLIVGSFAVGLPFGPSGVAIGYSVMSAVLALPLCSYALKGTSIRLRDLGAAVRFPALAAGLGIAAGWALPRLFLANAAMPWRAATGIFVSLGVYALVLLVVLKQGSFYRRLFMELLKKTPAAEVAADAKAEAK